jgi:SAM-dependent methyltransferase
MGNEYKGQSAHSAENFGDTRDHWWNRDFLELMATRWDLGVVRTVLDVGCGVGHWSMMLASVLPKDVRVTGIDREATWVEQASRRARDRGLSERFSYVQGSADALPFPDATFDLTTCQTVLIHLPDPAAAIREMMRVTKPGGLVAVAEPNNLSESLLLDSISNRASIDDVMAIVRFQITCERGKIALGEGDNSLGDRVAGLFVASGLTDVHAWVNDKATTIVPPYSTPEARAFIDEARDRLSRRMWNWSEPETRRFFLAGGGTERDFTVSFARALTVSERIVRGLEAGDYYGTFGGAFYLVSGRKPA